MHEIFHDKFSDRSTKISDFKSWLDTLIGEGIVESRQVILSMDNYEEHTKIRDCVVYYVCEYVTRQIKKKKISQIH